MRYVKDSPTSFAAAVDNLPKAGTQRRRILDAIRQYPEGVTRDELESAFSIGDRISGNAIRPRVRELQEAGLVEETERTRKTRSGSQATVLVAVNSGVDTGSGRSEAPGASVHSGVERSASPSGSAPPESLFDLPPAPSAFDPWERAA